MSPLATGWLPAALAGLAVTVLLGLPAPHRLLGGADGTARPWRPALPVGAVPVTVLLGLLVPFGPVVAVVGAVLARSADRALRDRRVRGARDQERDGALESLGVLAAELRAGQPPTVALTAAAQVGTGPTAHLLSRAAQTAALGGSAAEVLQAGATGCALPDLLRSLAVCWQVCHGVGSSLAVAVDRLEDGLRADRRHRETLDAELAAPRSTALLLAVLPGAGLLLGMGLGADPVHFLLRTAVGQGALAVGVGLDLAGLAWTRRIVTAAGAA